MSSRSVPPSRAPTLRTALRGLVACLVVATAAGCGLFGVDLGVEGIDARWMSVDNQNGREALLVTPEGFDPERSTEQLPAVLVLHGLANDAEDMARLAGWPAAARDRRFVAVFPDGVEKSWNAGGCCGAAVERNVDDVAYLDSLIDQLVAEEGVDPEQVFLTGYSNGAMMTYSYMCRRADRLAGAASVAGTDFDDGCEPAGAIPFLQISGADDPVVPVLGGESSFPELPQVPSVEQSVLAVARGAGCGPPTVSTVGSVQVFDSTGCRDGARVRYDVIAGLDHSYPNALFSPDYVAVDHILDFWGLGAP